MSLMNWSDSLAVGYAPIDRDHMKIVEMVNRLYEAIQVGHGDEVCGRILDELIDYTQTHFATEERLMAEHGYERAAEHRAEHAKLVAQVLEHRRRLQAGSVMVTPTMLQFLMDWLSHHILHIDRAMVQALTERA